MSNKSTVHLQPAPPTVLTAQEAVARLAALEACLRDIRDTLNHDAYCRVQHKRPCDCGVAEMRARIDALLQEGADA